jgi:hypothetical protein
MREITRPTGTAVRRIAVLLAGIAVAGTGAAAIGAGEAVHGHVSFMALIVMLLGILLLELSWL